MRTDVKMLLILHDETDMFGELSLYEAIVRRLHQLDISGATVQRGIMGFGSHGKVHRKGLFGISDDRPITICVVDTAEKLVPVRGTSTAVPPLTLTKNDRVPLSR